MKSITSRSCFAPIEGFSGFVIKPYQICLGFTLNLYLFIYDCIITYFKYSWLMPIIFLIINIFMSIFLYLDLNIMSSAFLEEYLKMVSIDDMLNPESSNGSGSGGNNSGSGGNNLGPEDNNSGAMVLMIQETIILRLMETCVIG